MDKELVQKVKGLLEKGDQKKIADETGLNVVTVNRFFNNPDEVSDESASLIISEAKKIIDSRNRLRQENEKTIKSLTDNSL